MFAVKQLFPTAPGVNRYLLTLLITLLHSTSLFADVQITDSFSLYSDFRYRLESDWDSKQANGVERDDRTRSRIRVRLGMEWKTSPTTLVNVRLRTGANDSQQGTHITIKDHNGNDNGPKDVNADKWFLKYQRDGFWASLGRNSLPFWKQNEFYWDDDVTPAGLSGGYRFNPHWEVSAIAAKLPAGMDNFSGDVAAIQLTHEGDYGNLQYKVAAGMIDTNAYPNDSGARLLLNGNGARDYRLWVGSLQLKTMALGHPLALGLDLMHNSQDYSRNDPDPNTAANHDQTDGFTLSAKLGSTKKPGDWLGGYYLARIEALAINSSFSQDDWVRWGSATQTRASDIRGQEFRLVYVPCKNTNLVGRLYLVDSIQTIEDGKRFRFDVNYRF